MPGSHIDGPQISRKRLYELYVTQGLSMPQIARLIGRSTDFVRRRLWLHGIPRKKRHRYPHPVPDDVLRDMYLRLNMSAGLIAKAVAADKTYGPTYIARATVLRRLKKAGVKLRHGGAGQRAKRQRERTPDALMTPDYFA